jgi:hypothetical protein
VAAVRVGGRDVRLPRGARPADALAGDVIAGNTERDIILDHDI